MHVASVPSRQGDREYKAYLLRQTYREGGKVKHRTLANLSALPLEAIEAVRSILRGQPVGALDEQLTIETRLPHGCHRSPNTIPLRSGENQQPCGQVPFHIYVD